MTIKKRCLLWDWTNTQGCPQAIDNVNFEGPISSIANWNTWCPPELKDRSSFRPHVRTEDQLKGEEWTRVENTDQPIIHYFNEPERAGISPERAAEAWKTHMLPLREKGKQLVSPSCASDPNGQDWTHRFMELVKDTPPDYLGLHWYGTDGNEMIKYLEQFHERYPKLPIVVSEFASVHRNKMDVWGLTIQLVNWLDEQEWIFEYALFGCMMKPADDFVSPAAQLMDEKGGFTELMVKYMDQQPMQW